MNWIEYTLQQPKVGELIFCEYPDANALPQYDFVIYTFATEHLNISKWKPIYEVPIIKSRRLDRSS